VEFAAELARVLPDDLPHRDRLIEKAAAHLSDSVIPWRHFAGARRVLDAGTGAGFPGVPLSLVLPDVRFTLAESTQKKARFVDSAVEHLELHNVEVSSDRAEQIALAQRPDIITARAVAPLDRLLEIFAKPMKQGAKLLLYKGPEVENELAAVKKYRIKSELLSRYDLPDGMGTRVLLAIETLAR
jgi:16S rRNA (guanine527-N7)-methyltransferase